jgi:hypothetical protein
VEEEQQDRDPIKENQLREKVQEVTINYLHCVKAVVQQSLIWQDMIA